MKKGDPVTENDIHLLSPGDGFKWHEKNKVIGKELIKDISKDEILYDYFIG